MEHKNNNNEFEHFLKDSIENFIMIPQRKVWYGIYNHLHPEKKWPSIAVCFCILVSIMHLGISNNKNINTETQNAKNAALNNKNIFEPQIVQDNTVALHQNAINEVEEKIANNNITTADRIYNSPTNSNQKKAESSSTLYDQLFTTSSTKNKFSVAIQNSTIEEDEIKTINTAGVKETNIEEEEKTSAQNNTTPKKTILESLTTTTKPDNKPDNKSENKEKKTDPKPEDNFASFATTVVIPKLRNRKEISYYITPSIGYRVLVQKEATKNTVQSTIPAVGAGITLSPYRDESLSIQDKQAFNLEIGSSVSHKINDRVKLTTGIQVNYTNYISKATTLDHPTQNAVASKNGGLEYRSMDFSSNPGKLNLNKTTLQISLPIGVEYKVLGNENVKLNVAASVQPSYVIAGSGYVLSADTKYYVSEKDLLNRFNASASLETFVSIKTASGIHFNVGPQVRYQLFSTYKKNYNFSEKLYNIGAKIGVSTSF